MLNFINKVLEYIWNMTIFLHEPIDYFLFVSDNKNIVIKDVMVNGEIKKLIFISQKLSYVRKGRFREKKIRQYKIEVVENSNDRQDEFPSRIFMVPELCSRIYKYTLIPHSCAINFVISKIKAEV